MRVGFVTQQLCHDTPQSYSLFKHMSFESSLVNPIFRSTDKQHIMD